jgi:hypothetical protein
MIREQPMNQRQSCTLEEWIALEAETRKELLVRLDVWKAKSSK